MKTFQILEDDVLKDMAGGYYNLTYTLIDTNQDPDFVTHVDAGNFHNLKSAEALFGSIQTEPGVTVSDPVFTKLKGKCGC